MRFPHPAQVGMGPAGGGITEIVLVVAVKQFGDVAIPILDSQRLTEIVISGNPFLQLPFRPGNAAVMPGRKIRRLRVRGFTKPAV